MRSLCLFVIACGAGPVRVDPRPPPAVADPSGYAATLETGDPRAYEGWIRDRWTAAALAESPAEDRASQMARTFTDTGGLAVERVVVQPQSWQLSAQARRTGIAYCVTVRRDGDRIADIAVTDVYPAGPALTDPEPEEVVALARRLAEAYTRAGEFSGQVLIERRGTVHFRRAYGTTDLAHGLPATLATRFNGASIGKSMTGVAIAQLVEAGKLRFDDVVGAVLPDYPDREVRETVTIRQLLTHTSGMGPEDYYDGPQWAIARTRMRTVDDYLKLVIGRPLGARPGERYEYSNSGYVVLGAVIEKLTGQRFHDYVRDHIFVPAGMTRSFYPEVDGQDPDVATPLTNFVQVGELAYRYSLGRPRDAGLELAARGGPQGGAAFTADDLLAFERALLAGKLVSSATVAMLFAPQAIEVAGRRGAQSGVHPGLGFEITQRNGHTMIGHQGGDFGIASMVYRFPETGYTMIVLSNRDARAGRVMLAALRALITRRTIGAAEVPAHACVPPG